MYFEIWVGVALLGVLLGVWYWAGVMYNNSNKAARQMDEIISLLRRLAEKE